MPCPSRFCTIEVVRFNGAGGASVGFAMFAGIAAVAVFAAFAAVGRIGAADLSITNGSRMMDDQVSCRVPRRFSQRGTTRSW